MLYIVLPAYNEEQALSTLISDLEKECGNREYKIIIVNDGSTDNTETVARELNTNGKVDIITHSSNLGLGAALLTGFYKACSTNDLNQETSDKPDVIITMDSDNTHPVDRITLMMDKILQGSDLVIASRYMLGAKQYGLSFYRKVLSRGAGILMKLVFPISGVKDYSCGYRAYRITVIEEALNLYGNNLIESQSFAAMVEVLIKTAPLCAKIEEVPLELHYERKCGQSKMKVFVTIIGYFKLILRLKFRAKGSMVWIPEE